jgi:hypothetical protein
LHMRMAMLKVQRSFSLGWRPGRGSTLCNQFNSHLTKFLIHILFGESSSISKKLAFGICKWRNQKDY